MGAREMNDMYQSRALVREEIVLFLIGKEPNKTAKSRTEEARERLGSAVVKVALNRKNDGEDSSTTKGNYTEIDVEGGGEKIEPGSGAVAMKAKQARKCRGYQAAGLHFFRAYLQEAGVGRIELERKQPEFRNRARTRGRGENGGLQRTTPGAPVRAKL